MGRELLRNHCVPLDGAKTAAMEAVLKDYTQLLETLEEINSTTHDEYGLIASGLMQSLEKFSTLFGLRLSHLLFSAADQVFLTLQKKREKYIALQDALSAVDAAKQFFKTIQSENN